MKLAFAIVLTVASAIGVNLGYVLEQRAAAVLPPLSLRRPVASIRLLFGSRGWVRGAATETVGFLCFVGAVWLAPLAVVQSIAAGGIGILAFLVARPGAGLSRRELVGVVVSVTGLACLGVSLAGAHGEGDRPGLAVALWLAGSAVLAVVVLGAARRDSGGTLFGVAAGLLFATGDIATKALVSHGFHIAFAPALVAGYGLGTAALQLGFQRGGPLTTAGIATLLTNALPIAAATAVLHEPVPRGGLRAVRILAFAAVVVGGVLLARPRAVMPAPDVDARAG